MFMFTSETERTISHFVRTYIGPRGLRTKFSRASRARLFGVSIFSCSAPFIFCCCSQIYFHFIEVRSDYRRDQGAYSVLSVESLSGLYFSSRRTSTRKLTMSLFPEVMQDTEELESLHELAKSGSSDRWSIIISLAQKDEYASSVRFILNKRDELRYTPLHCAIFAR
jgi:hypothetical protein